MMMPLKLLGIDKSTHYICARGGLIVCFVLIRAQAAENLNALNKKNEALQENYSGRHLDASLDHSILSMNSISEYADKYVPWPLPEHVHQHRPAEALGMRWGDENRTAQESVSESMMRRAASPDPNEPEDPVAGAPSEYHAKSPHYFAWHPRNEFADVAAHGTYPLLLHLL